MALLVDAERVPPPLRVEAVNAAMASTEMLMRFRHNSDDEVRLRIDCWATGSGSHLLRALGSASRFDWDRRHLRVTDPRRVAVMLVLRTGLLLSAGGVDDVAAPGHLHLVDQTRPFRLSWSRPGGFLAFVVDYDRLSMPADLIRTAGIALRRSPVYDLFRAHLSRLGDADDEHRMGSARGLVGAATTELLRALIASAARGADRGPTSVREILQVRVRIYIERHLNDPNLCAGRIADAHNISVRQLYKVWARNEDVSLSEWIIAARLEGARHDLGRSGKRPATIGAVARQWGFTDATHFSRRFRAAFGLSPREWAAAAPGTPVVDDAR